MKKIYLFSATLFLFIQSVRSQNIYYDIMNLSSLQTPKGTDSAFKKETIGRFVGYFAVEKDDTTTIDYSSMYAALRSAPKLRQIVSNYLLGENNDSIATLLLSHPPNARTPGPITNLYNAAKKMNDAKDTVRIHNISKATNDSLSVLKLKNIAVLDAAINKLMSYNSPDSSALVPGKQQRKAADSVALEEMRGVISYDSLIINKFSDSIPKLRTGFNNLLTQIETGQNPGDLLKQLGSTQAMAALVSRNSAAVNNFDFSTNFQNNQNPFENTESKPGGETTSLTNFHMPSQSELIDALSIYIAKRFKQEVALSMMSQLVKVINRQQLLKELFPETVKMFNDNDPNRIPQFGKMWNHALGEDFIKLPENICGSNYIQQFFSQGTDQQMYHLFNDMVRLSGWVIQKNALPEMVSLYKADTSVLKCTPVKQCMNMLDMINTEFSDTLPGRYWISWKNLSAVKETDLKIMLALLERKYKSSFRTMPLGMPSTWGDRGGQLTVFKNYFTKALVTLNTFQTGQKQYMQAIEKDPNTAYTGMNFWDFQKNIFTLLLNDTIIPLNGKAKEIVSLISRSTELYKLMEQKNYAALIHESVNILEEIMPDRETRLNDLLVKKWKMAKEKYAVSSVYTDSTLSRLNGVFQNAFANFRNDRSVNAGLVNDLVAGYDSLLKKNKDLLVIQSKAELIKLLDEIKADNSLAKYNLVHQPSVKTSQFAYIMQSAGFFVDVISASGSAQLSKVIEAYSLPANSYKIKRNSRISWDLNAYVGTYAGVEYFDHKAAPLWGLSVPVGVTFSWGSHSTGAAIASSTGIFLTKRGKFEDLKGNCKSLSFTLIDIAAPVAYRITNDSAKALPRTVKWAQVLSPGVHFRVGIKNTPLCFSTGVQYTPELRTINQSNLNGQAWRVYVGLFFDLPLFNFYHR